MEVKMQPQAREMLLAADAQERGDAGASEMVAAGGGATSSSAAAGLSNAEEELILADQEFEGRSIDPVLLEEERLSKDPDWPESSLWLLSYLRMHRVLKRQALAINSGEEEDEGGDPDPEPSLRSSIDLLMKEVFALCPMQMLVPGMVISIGLVYLSFAVPHAQGALVDVAVNAAKRHLEDRESIKFWPTIMPSLALVIVFMFGSWLLEIVVSVLIQLSGHTTVTRLRARLFKNLSEQEAEFYDSFSSGELSSRLINDSASLSDLMQWATQSLVRAPVKFAGALFAMFATNWRLALVATLITPVNTALAWWAGYATGLYATVQNAALAEANGVATEVLGGVRTVQANVGEVREARRFASHMNRYLRVVKATVYVQSGLDSVSDGIWKLRDVMVLAYAMYLVIDGQMSIGVFTAFQQYITLYEDGFENLTNVYVNFKGTVMSTGKFVQLLKRRSPIPVRGGKRPDSCEGRLVFEDVSFAYTARPDRQVLSGVSLRAGPGDVIALVGESGAGKTTLGRLLLRYYDPTSGQLTLDGVDYRELSVRWLRAQVGFVEQEPVLFDRSLRENIAYGSAFGKSEACIEQAARQANAHDFILDLADGYDTSPGERAARISGGQKQRIAIARAIIRDPKVLLLDEATSALDGENEQIVQRAIDTAMVGKTTFIIAHRLSTVVRATRILVLEKGVVIESGSHDELVSNESSKYSSFMRHQMVSVSPLLQ